MTLRYPTPVGWKSVRRDDSALQALFDDCRYDLDNDRFNGLTSPKKEQTCFCYIAVVQMREQGFLDKHNEPNTSALHHTREHCSVDVKANNPYPDPNPNP